MFQIWQSTQKILHWSMLLAVMHLQRVKLDYTCGLERIYTREEIAKAKKFPSSGENTTYNILALSVIEFPFEEHSFHCWESTTKIWGTDYQNSKMTYNLSWRIGRVNLLSIPRLISNNGVWSLCIHY